MAKRLPVVEPHSCRQIMIWGKGLSLLSYSAKDLFLGACARAMANRLPTNRHLPDDDHRFPGPRL